MDTICRPFTTRETLQKCDEVLDIVFEYSLHKFDDTMAQLALGRPKFLSAIEHFVAQGKRVDMCLPAFPFKSANKTYKVLGVLPDKADELALQRLNTICKRIKDIYSPGAAITIISDGLVYNDLLCVSDRDTWAYGEALRSAATQQKLSHLEFSRIKDLVDFPSPDKLNEITYVASATNFRRYLLNQYGNDSIDIEHEIATNGDVMATYLGYRRFLVSDLHYIFPLSENRSKTAYKKNVKYLAQQMLIRGFAFASAVKAAYPNHLRLSIHQSTGEHKISLSLLNTNTGFTTPWHCSVALMATGEWLSAPKGDFERDPRFEVVHENGRPSYFQEHKVEDESLSDGEPALVSDTTVGATNDEPSYPHICGVKSSPKSSEEASVIEASDNAKLAEHFRLEEQKEKAQSFVDGAKGKRIQHRIRRLLCM